MSERSGFLSTPQDLWRPAHAARPGSRRKRHHFKLECRHAAELAAKTCTAAEYQANPLTFPSTNGCVRPHATPHTHTHTYIRVCCLFYYTEDVFLILLCGAFFPLKHIKLFDVDSEVLSLCAPADAEIIM